MNAIPIMDDPMMGKHWQQPHDISSAPMDETHVILTPAQVDALLKYDRSMPSGVYPGKCWMRREHCATYLVWYGEETADHKCPILFRHVLDLVA
jgi:hypothetical protein